MKIPELSYSFNNDEYVYRQSRVQIGDRDVLAEAITVGGKPGKPNQDTFGFSKDGEALRCIVLDGAVSRNVSHIARDLFEQSHGIATARDVLASINTDLSRIELDGGASTATVVGLADEVDLAHVTDSWAMALLHDNSTRLLTIDQHEKFDTKALKIMARIALSQGLDMATARQHPAVKEALVAMFRAVRNTPDGSGEGILNGSPYMDQYIQTLEYPLKTADVAMLLIGSDGARFPHRSEKDPAYRRELFRLVAVHGLERVVELMRQAEIANPPTPTHPRWSLHDDKTLIALTPQKSTIATTRTPTAR